MVLSERFWGCDEGAEQHLLRSPETAQYTAEDETLAVIMGPNRIE